MVPKIENLNKQKEKNIGIIGWVWVKETGFR